MQKRFFLLLMTVVFAMAFSACDEATSEAAIDYQAANVVTEKSETSFPEVTATQELEPAAIPHFQTLADGDHYLSFLAQYPIVGAPTATQVETDWGVDFYLLTYEMEADQEIHLALYPKADQFYVVIWELESFDEIGETYAAYSFQDHSYLGSISGSTNGDDGGGIVLRPTCRESSSSFKECFICGVGELMTDPVSRYVCTITPKVMALCAAGIGLHCAAGDYPDTN